MLGVSRHENGTIHSHRVGVITDHSMRSSIPRIQKVVNSPLGALTCESPKTFSLGEEKDRPSKTRHRESRSTDKESGKSRVVPTIEAQVTKGK